MAYVIPLVMLAFMIVTLIDIVTRDDSQVKHLPKMIWIILAIVIPLVGGIVWWAVGREYPERPVRRFASYEPTGRTIAPPPAPTRTTEQQLADLEREIEVERLRAEVARRRRERGEA